jgi:hypothetical protein
MVRSVSAPIVGALPDALARLLAAPLENAAALSEALEGEIQLERVCEALSSFFDALVTADAFLELRDIETYASITEGHQLYLYVGAVKFRAAQYPLFFLPVDVIKLDGGRGFQLSPSNQLFANRAGVEFVLQELAQAKGREWINPINDRILYLTPEQSILEVARGLYNAITASLGLTGQTELSVRGQDATAVDVALSPALHLCAFEQGEEALLNDYEEIITLARQGGSAIVDLFQKLVGGVLTENPIAIGRHVEREWDGLPMVDRMVFDSPIPLNEEQRKIMLAVRNTEGHIVVVEGPPGTGKSHTITAIAADCAFNQKSCLILSDKGEALQVVYDKLSEAMSRVRHVRDFPNPILRLGRQDANFRGLVGTQTISQVSAYAKASQKNMPNLIAERDGAAKDLKSAIELTVQTMGNIHMSTIARMHSQEAKLRTALPKAVAAIQALQPGDTVPALLTKLRQSHSDQDAPFALLEDYLTELRSRTVPTELAAGAPAGSCAAVRLRANVDLAIALVVKDLPGELVTKARLFSSMTVDQARLAQSSVLQYRQLKMPVLGYLLRGRAVRQLEGAINALPVTEPVLLKTSADDLVQLAKITFALHEQLDKVGCASWVARSWPDLPAAVQRQQAANVLLAALDLVDAVPGLPEAMQGCEPHLWRMVTECLSQWLEVRGAFENAPQIDYVGTKSKIERLNTSLMNGHVDSRLVEFIEEHRADAKIMAAMIAQRQKFPEDKFDVVKKSFPIILAGIREFGEYMPLAPELFDVIVIDEASQVSVAQALPALLRAKKIVVLGDSKQFSNVKSANASNQLNDKYRANLVQFFERNITRDAQALQRLAMFDVKRSVLEFCSLAASYSVMLRKHFRSYPELIGYSSKTFYRGNLQALKVRSRPIDEVIRFEQIDPEGHTCTRAVNEAEARAILARLEEMLGQENPPTVGVVTPFREQLTLLQKTLFSHPKASEFEERLKLRVWTFDTVQGEERSIIIYSLVATPGNDALNYIFPVSLEGAEESVEDKLKMQRLNVGFSRAQDCIWFVHSMPLGMYKGALAQALHHYRGVLDKKAPTAKQTDQNSPMEAKVLDWLQQTSFVQGQPDDVEIIPQFPIGEYLKQLDHNYTHPAWRVDFLLVYRKAKGQLHIVIEYDGFEFHFDKDRPGSVNVGNHERYLVASDVERQLTLESYGYRFLRINRFNLGPDPVATLDARLAKLVEVATGEQSSQFPLCQYDLLHLPLIVQ